MISVILVIIFAFLAGMEGVLDEFQFHQPLVACTLIGLATGHLVPCIMLGGSLQMIALGWANIGAAVALLWLPLHLPLFLFKVGAKVRTLGLPLRSPSRWPWLVYS